MTIGKDKSRKSKRKAYWASIQNTKTHPNPDLVDLTFPATTPLTTHTAIYYTKISFNKKITVRLPWESTAKTMSHRTITMKTMKPWSRAQSHPLSPHLIAPLRNILPTKEMPQGQCRNIPKALLIWQAVSLLMEMTQQSQVEWSKIMRIRPTIPSQNMPKTLVTCLLTFPNAKHKSSSQKPANTLTTTTTDSLKHITLSTQESPQSWTKTSKHKAAIKNHIHSRKTPRNLKFNKKPNTMNHTCHA